MSAKRYLGTFYRGRRLYIPVLLLLLVATVLGTYYLARTQYEATARIWVDKPALDSVLDPNAPSTTLFRLGSSRRTRSPSFSRPTPSLPLFSRIRPCLHGLRMTRIGIAL